MPYGDPLPPGVVARLGTERLTLTNTGSELTFSPDGRRLATYDFADVVEALEANDTEETRQALVELSKGSTDAVLTRESKASLERLSRQPVPTP